LADSLEPMLDNVRSVQGIHSSCPIKLHVVLF
jgi:hypothetical protein